MFQARILVALCLTAALYSQTPSPSAHSVNERFTHLTIDQNRIYRVRELRLNRGGVKIYLNDGILAFATPVEGRIMAAVFTTQGVDAGDAEVLALPPNRSERTSLAAAINTPTLNDHFGTAVFFFSDSTVDDCLKQLPNPTGQSAPELLDNIAPALNPVLRNLYPTFDLNLIEALLDGHKPEGGFFLATFGGRDLGPFNFLYDPSSTEPVVFGRTDLKQNRFQLWTSYRESHSPPAVSTPSRFTDYRIHAKIADDLRLSATAQFQYRCDDTDGRSLRFDLSNHLHVTAASIDGAPAEVFSHSSGSFLVIAPQPLTPAVHQIAVQYEGEVIRHTAARTYFVEERNTWYPRAGTTSAIFDLTFECPAALQLVSTGELISNTVEKGIRTVHRRTPTPDNIAGFNLGEYRVTSTDSPPYRVDVFANRNSEPDLNLGSRAASILQTYTQWWSTLPLHSLVVSPISGYFGQGFPGLIYLSDISYLSLENRPTNLRTPHMDSFFSSMLLPHEVAHQWWGNLVVAADYRAAWLTEAMATHSALEYLASREGDAARTSLLSEYKKDLQHAQNGKPVESLGPVDFGIRLIDSGGYTAWHTIAYEKGAWILRMLQTRIGDDRWRQVQLALLKRFATQPITNDAFRQAVAQALPPGQPDKDLQLFFDTWVYSTGIPRLALSRHASGWELEVSGVADDFTADIPIHCHTKSGKVESIRWLRATPGANVLPAAETTRVCTLPPPDRFLYLE